MRRFAGGHRVRCAWTFGRTSAAFAAALGLALPAPVATQSLDLPPRATDAATGSALTALLTGLELEEREERVYAEIVSGNVPSWLRELTPVRVTRRVGERPVEVEFRVLPDYLAVGSDADHLRIPLSPQTAQRLADELGLALPTTMMVDAVWAAASVRLPPDTIPPSDQMTTVPVFAEHDRRVRRRRALDPTPLGALVAGHKKDVVVSAELGRSPGRVAIYGWHRPSGQPIQPLYLGHTDRWVDYSHGIRLVHPEIRLDGARVDLSELLRDPALASALSDEGVVPEPRYRIR